MDAEIKVPQFRVLANLEGFPIELWKDEEVIKAVSSFGTYLGSVQPENLADFSKWTVIVATADLAKVPLNVAVKVAGVEKLVLVKVITWSHAPVYKEEELPKQPPTYTRPLMDTPDSSDGGDNMDDEEMIPVSIRAIQEICVGIDPASLPEQLRELVVGRDNGDNTGSQQSHAILDPCRQQATRHFSEGQGPQTGTPTESQTIRTWALKNRETPHVAIGVLNSLVNSEVFTTQLATHNQPMSQPKFGEPQGASASTPKKRSPKGKEKLDQPRDRVTTGQRTSEKNEKLHHTVPKQNPTRETKQAPTPRRILTRDPKKLVTQDPKPPCAPAHKPKKDVTQAR